MHQKIIDRLQRAVQERVFPGCVLGIVNTQGERHILPVGHLTYESDAPLVTENTLYDLASVTKAIPGSSSLLKLIDEGRLGLEDRLFEYVRNLEIAMTKKKYE